MFKLLILLLALSAPGQHATLNSRLEIHLNSTGTSDIIVSLKSTTSDIIERISSTKFSTREERLNALGTSLKSHALKMQSRILNLIQGIPALRYETLWITNQVFIENAPAHLVKLLSQLPEVYKIEENGVIKQEPINQSSNEKPIDQGSSKPPNVGGSPSVPWVFSSLKPRASSSDYPNPFLTQPTPTPAQGAIDGCTVDEVIADYPNPFKVNTTEVPDAFPNPFTPHSNSYTCGVPKINSTGAWNIKNDKGVMVTGEGVIVGVIDSGARFTHDVFKGRYRGEYGWFDPYKTTCLPSESNGHGTHVMGTIVGLNGIGVAPGAKYMACRACYRFSCTVAALVSCGQWMLCPTLANGTKADCSKAPHIINNSWGGGTETGYYDQVIKAWKAAGIIPVFSAANSDGVATCSSVMYPEEHPDVITVGGTDCNDFMANFSNKGPTRDGRVKPDFVAPGVNIVSASQAGDSLYNTLMGTSMAAPHVTGTIALLLSARPELTMQDIKLILDYTADFVHPTGINCGSVAETPKYYYKPNNAFGHGRINAGKAVYYAVNEWKPNFWLNPFEAVQGPY